MRILRTIMMAAVIAVSASRGEAAPSGMDDLIVVDHPPVPVGGSGSDTSFLDMFGQPIYQRVADNIVLTEFAAIGSIVWWGFYNEDNPPAQETFRIRFYESRPLDGLPDEANIAFEQMVDTPTRTATGRTVFVGVDPDEYRYELDFSASVSLLASTTYWLEIAQLGDIGTHFRWEFSQIDLDGRALNNPIAPEWLLSTTLSDTAYQLIAVPEPSSLALMMTTLCAVQFAVRINLLSKAPLQSWSARGTLLAVKG